MIADEEREKEKQFPISSALVEIDMSLILLKVSEF